MALYKKLDLWSIFDELDKITDYCFNGNETESPYWDYYYDQINELCNMAADLYLSFPDSGRKHLRGISSRTNRIHAGACGPFQHSHRRHGHPF